MWTGFFILLFLFIYVKALFEEEEGHHFILQKSIVKSFNAFFSKLFLKFAEIVT